MEENTTVDISAVNEKIDQESAFGQFDNENRMPHFNSSRLIFNSPQRQ